eukprot:5026625-Karenia_brevis.AAC.1
MLGGFPGHAPKRPGRRLREQRNARHVARQIVLTGIFKDMCGHFQDAFATYHSTRQSDIITRCSKLDFNGH